MRAWWGVWDRRGGGAPSGGGGLKGGSAGAARGRAGLPPITAAEVVRAGGRADADRWGSECLVIASIQSKGPSINKCYKRSVIARESERSSNHVASIGAQPITWWLLDAPLSRGMTPN